MKICYCDESGLGDEPIAVMAGIVVDAQRMHVTKDYWYELLQSLAAILGKPVLEIHTRDFYSGNGLWRSMGGVRRAQAIGEIFTWLAARKHRVVYTAVVKAEVQQLQRAAIIPSELGTMWRFLAYHLLLAIQRHFQREEKKKGNTIFVFDNEEREVAALTDLALRPPAWSDSYYAKGKKQRRLDQLIDVPYFSDSTGVALLQVADFVAYFLRRFAELTEGHSPLRYPEELDRITEWLRVLKPSFIPSAAIYPATGRCDCANMFFDNSPAAIRELQRRL